MERFVSPLPDGRGLPPGSGSFEQGKVLYAQQCAACHGASLEGGIGDRLIGGRGSLVNDTPAKAPVKTVESYWPYATTLFDYIKRAMPFTAPDSLTNDQVYALCAYILAQARIVPENAVLDAASLAKVAMPNRDGFVSDPRPEKFPPVADTPHQDRAIGASAR
jgi:cytochrome c